MRRWCMVILCILLLCGCAAPPPTDSALPPPFNPTDEVRGMWVSYLELDAAFGGATPQSAAAYIDQMMDTLSADGFNTVFFHVRAYGDAYYVSDTFPAARAVQGLLHSGFDPLAYAITAAHTRGLSFHAWINPYRIGDDRTRAVTEDVYEWEGCFYYIPTSLSAQKKILDGVRELVRRYAVDGVQYDDYFYPAGLPQTAMSFEQFPDGVTVEEGRRAAVNALISATYSAVHTRKGCLFGVSPAADIDRNRETLYADAARWLKITGYVDYMCPQLYSGFLNERLPFAEVSKRWADLPRAEGVQLCAGLAFYKTGEADAFAGTGADEWQKEQDIIARQIDEIRRLGYNGVALFRYGYWTDPATDIRTAEKSDVHKKFE